MRVGILKILTSMFEHNKDDKKRRRAMVKEHGLKKLVKELAADPAVIVVDLAAKLTLKIEEKSKEKK